MESVLQRPDAVERRRLPGTQAHAMLAPCITTTTPMEALFDHSGADLRLEMRRWLDGDGDGKERRLGAAAPQSPRQAPLDARKQRRGRRTMGRSRHDARGLSSGKLFHLFVFVMKVCPSLRF